MLDKAALFAYQQTHYQVSDIVLKIGEVSKVVKQLLIPFSPLGGIFITAWNPLGVVATDEQNQQANISLKADLIAKGLMVIKGVGRSGDDTWHEDSFFAYPLDEKAAQQLCQKYLQNAVVYVNNSGMPSLMLNQLIQN